MIAAASYSALVAAILTVIRIIDGSGVLSFCLLAVEFVCRVVGPAKRDARRIIQG